MRLPTVFRENGPALGAALVIVVLLSAALRWILTHHERPTGAPRKVVTLTGAVLKPPEPLKPTAPPPPPVVKPKQIDEPQRNRVEIKATDIPPPTGAPPPQNAPGGRLSLASEATGEGDAFNLVGNPGGRGLLSGGGLGDGIGGGMGSGTGGRYAWYYSKIAAQLEEELRKSKRLSTAEARVELRIWTDSSGRITRVQLIRSTGNREIDEAIQSVVGLRLRDPPPADIPMPMIARVIARRPG
jgi:TonB family protein